MQEDGKCHCSNYCLMEPEMLLHLYQLSATSFHLSGRILHIFLRQVAQPGNLLMSCYLAFPAGAHVSLKDVLCWLSSCTHVECTGCLPAMHHRKLLRCFAQVKKPTALLKTDLYHA